LTAATITAAMRHFDEATLTGHLRSALSSRSVPTSPSASSALEHYTVEVAVEMLRHAANRLPAPQHHAA